MENNVIVQSRAVSTLFLIVCHAYKEYFIRSLQNPKSISRIVKAKSVLIAKCLNS